MFAVNGWNGLSPVAASMRTAGLSKRSMRVKGARSPAAQRLNAVSICKMHFDVFQCHNSVDKEEVRRICRLLEKHSLRTWLDDEQIQPGRPWQAALEVQIPYIPAAAVYVGSSNLGPWQVVELEAFMRQFVQRRSPVIPVLLRGASEPPKLPTFLMGMRWVDFRRNQRRALLELVWGITGKRPPELDT